MQQRLKCWQCGKPAVVTPQDAGLRTVCAACGAIQDVPEDAPGGAKEGRSAVSRFAAMWGDRQEAGARAPIAEEEQANPVIKPLPPSLAPATVDLPKGSVPLPAGEEDGGPVDPKRPPATGAASWWPLWVAGFAVAGMVAVLVIMLNRGDATASANQQQQMLAQVMTLRQEAWALEKKGDLSGAMQKYSEIGALVANQSITDAALIEELERTRAARERLAVVLQTTASDPFRDTMPAEEITPSIVVTKAATRPTITSTVKPDAPPDRAVPTTRVVYTKRPPPQPEPVPVNIVGDDEIGLAIQRGARFIQSQFSDGVIRRDPSLQQAHYAGLDALCVYALLAAGDATNDPKLSVRDPKIRQMLDRLRDLSVKGHYETYARSLRLTALTFHNRAEDRSAIREDYAALMKAQRRATFTYGGDDNPQGQLVRWDNSNTQYGLLGIWAAAEAGLEVPRSFWAQAQNHWTEEQLQDGQWGYYPGDRSPRIGMTLAGIASLLVTHDYLEGPQFVTTTAGAAAPSTRRSSKRDEDEVTSGVGRRPFSDPLVRGLAWLERDNNAVAIPMDHEWTGYYLFGVERIGLASGFKYFGAHDWYRVLAERIVRQQGRDGSWAGASGIGVPAWALGLVDTKEARDANVTELHNAAFRLLFLSRGRHPILMNKLRYTGAWANRPRDVANLTRYASKALERGLNWQVVPVEQEFHTWLDAPILYFANHVRPSFGEKELEKLKQYMLSGGMLFTQADGDSGAFNTWVETLPRKLLGLDWRDLPEDHELYSANFKVDPRPRLRYVTNGVRVLWVHSPEDLSQHWQLRADKSKRYAFDVGLNLFLHAAGRTDLRNRLSSPHLPEPAGEPKHVLRVARVRHGALPNEWDPEPMAWPRFARWMRYETGYGVEVGETLATQLSSGRFDLAHLTGIAAYITQPREIEALRRFVEGGGTLLVDACGGSRDFADGVRATLETHAFPGRRFGAMRQDHPVLAGRAPGMTALPKLGLRPYAERKLGKSPPPVEVLEAGSGRVIFSTIDVTAGLLATHGEGIVGYQPATAQALVRNVLLWSADGAPAAGVTVSTTGPATTSTTAPAP